MLARPKSVAIELEQKDPKSILKKTSDLPEIFLSDIRNALATYDKAWLKSIDVSNAAHIQSLRRVGVTLGNARVQTKCSLDSPLSCHELLQLTSVLLNFTVNERDKNHLVKSIFDAIIVKFPKSLWDVIKARKKRISADELALMARYPNPIGHNYVNALNTLDGCECHINNREIREFISQPEHIVRSSQIVDAFFILEAFFKPRTTSEIINLISKFLKENKQLKIAYYIEEISEEYSPESSAPLYDLCVSSSTPLADIHQLILDLRELTFCRNANFDYVTQLMCSHPKLSADIANAYTTLIDKKMCVVKHKEINPLVKFVIEHLIDDGNTHALQAVCIIKDKLGVVSEDSLQALNSKEALEAFINLAKAELKIAPQESKPKMSIQPGLFAEKKHAPKQSQDDIAVPYRAYPPI